jgi:hypothetical protein
MFHLIAMTFFPYSKCCVYFLNRKNKLLDSNIACHNVPNTEIRFDKSNVSAGIQALKQVLCVDLNEQGEYMFFLGKLRENFWL